VFYRFPVRGREMQRLAIGGVDGERGIGGKSELRFGIVLVWTVRRAVARSACARRPNRTHYDKFAPKWKRVRDVRCRPGRDARGGRPPTCPSSRTRDGTGDYDNARVKRSDFFNGTWRTIDALGGMAFRKPPTVDVPKAIEPYLDDIT
jgi:hypothetical protein